MEMITKTIPWGEHPIEIETGRIARQASGSVLVKQGDTHVLVTAVGSKEPRAGATFFPLTVQYLERTYAAGKIPGGFFKREGRPSEKETLTSRLIDRPIRPLFPKGFSYDVHVVATVVSLDPDIASDVLAMIGASAALALSGLPFQGPIAAARVGYSDGEFMLNPDLSQLAFSQLDLVVAGTRDAVLMVESDAQMLPESVMLEAVMYGHEQMQVVIDAIDELVKEVGVVPRAYELPAVDASVEQQVAGHAEAALGEAYRIADKIERQAQVDTLRQAMLDDLRTEDGDDLTGELKSAFGAIEKRIVRSRVLAGEKRIDGRDLVTVRPITIDVGVLPRTHGSALFTRGETQALVVTTLGTDRDAQTIDALEGERKETFMLHYNFPPYCVGEAGMVLGPKRREIGHGNLARRGVMSVLPSQDHFPYVIRVVSEITESNGSSSMASICGSSLAMMDAGVPLAAPVAGIAMGLIKEGDDYAVLTDILGDEDHLGDMDFKVAGTAEGVTALQMDIKIAGITREIMEKALAQARDGRLHILKLMEEAIPGAREEMSAFAPRVIMFKVAQDKIRDVIGKGGSTIRSIIEETGASIDIDDDGTVRIYSVDQDSGKQAQKTIEDITADVEVGCLYDGQVVKITDFGAFVRVLPGKEGLVHISQIAHERVEKVTDHLSEGQSVRVKVIEIDRQGRVRLSMKAVEETEA